MLPHIKRIAVSDHLLLGGDNIDLALAHHIERQLAAELSARAVEFPGRALPRFKGTLPDRFGR